MATSAPDSDGVRDRIKRCVPDSFARRLVQLGSRLDTHPLPVFPSLEATLVSLRDRGFRPQRFIDVGAYEGVWSEQFRAMFPDSSGLMVEAMRGKADTLVEVERRCGGLVHEIAVLGATDGAVVTFTEMETGSSVYEERSPFGQRAREERTTVTLDSLVRDGHPDFATADLIKLDVQGFELQVLDGATAVVADAELLLLEASLVPVNEGCPLIADVISYLSARDFRLLDVCSQIRRQDGVLWQTDLMFVKNDSILCPDPSLDAHNWH